MGKRTFSELEAEEHEAKAEAEIQAVIAAHEAAPKDQKFRGLGDDVPPLYFKVRPEGPKPSQYLGAGWGAKASEKPLILTYFAIRGLGEVQRLILAEAGADYDEICPISGGDSHAQCWRARSPNGLLATLSGLGVPRRAPLSQSSSIIRFLGRRFGMAGTSELEACRIDTLFETSKDLGGKGVATWEEEEAKGPKGPWELAKRIETILEDMPSPGDPTAAMNYGQMQLYHALTNFELKAPGSVKRLSGPLHQFMQACSARTRIASYLASSHRFPATNSDAGKEGSGYHYVSGPLVRGDM